MAASIAAVFELPSSCRLFANVDRAAGRAGGERGIGCGTCFLSRVAFPHGEHAENKLKTAISGTGNLRKKTSRISHFFPLSSRLLVGLGSSRLWSRRICD